MMNLKNEFVNWLSCRMQDEVKYELGSKVQFGELG